MVLFYSILFSQLAFSQGQIPLKPTAPPQLSQPIPRERFRCKRQMMYQGKLLNCDSGIYQNAEQLRPILIDVPEAIRELDLYQESRRSANLTAYAVSAGLGLALLSYLVAKQITDESGAQTGTSLAIQRLGVISGVSIAAGSLIIGFGFLKGTESHLGNAVQIYNQKRPNDPIELQFSTGISF